MSYDSSNLTTPDIKWLGVRPSDLDRFNIPQQCRLPMTEEDVKTGKKLVKGGAEEWGVHSGFFCRGVGSMIDDGVRVHTESDSFSIILQRNLRLGGWGRVAVCVPLLSPCPPKET
jgi:hypothetical protein